jgi:hypothetical protein
MDFVLTFFRHWLKMRIEMEKAMSGLRKFSRDTTKKEMAWRGVVNRRLSGLESGNEHEIKGRCYL